MNRRPEPLGALLPGVLADLARRQGIELPATLTERTPTMATTAEMHDQPVADPVVEAVNLLHAGRHQLPPDVLRSLASIWQCASAARYGEPYEEFWSDQGDFYAEHDVDQCESDNQAGAA